MPSPAKKKTRKRKKRRVRIQWTPGAAQLEQIKESGPVKYETEGERRAAFLGVLAQTGNVQRSCDLTGFPRTDAYRARKNEPDFAKLWEEAVELGIEALEDEARRRAQLGVDEPVYQGGRQVGTIRKFSDTLTIFLLKGAKPEKYRDNVNIRATTRNVNANLDVDMKDPVAAQDAYRKMMEGDEGE